MSESRLLDVITACLNRPPSSLTVANGTADASWSSLDQITLMMELEVRFGVQFTLDEIVGTASVGAIQSLLAAKGVAISL